MTNKIFKISGLVIFFLGFSLLIISVNYPKYTNEQEYQKNYMKLSGGQNDTDRFYELRQEYLTPKFELENYGFSFIELSIGILAISFIGLKRLKTPNKIIWIVLIGIIAAVISNIGYVGDLFLEMERDAYPHWADSLGIPLMGVPFLFISSLAWVGVNLLGINKNFKKGELIFPIKLKKLNYWYATLLLLTIIITISSIATGQFWFIIPGFLWIYFYLSIMIGKVM